MTHDHPDPLSVLAEIEQSADQESYELARLLSAAAFTPEPDRSWWRRVRGWFNRKEK